MTPGANRACDCHIEGAPGGKCYPCICVGNVICVVYDGYLQRDADTKPFDKDRFRSRYIPRVKGWAINPSFTSTWNGS